MVHLNVAQRPEHLGRDQKSIYWLMPLAESTPGPVVCRWRLILRHLYRDIGDHLSLGVPERILLGVFKKNIWDRGCAIFPMTSPIPSMASSNLLSL
jgi:hypothetical protein